MNVYGWSGCEKRTKLYGNAETVESAPPRSLLAALPPALQVTLQPVTKYTDNHGNKSNIAENVTSSIDYLWDLSEFEVQGRRSVANIYEQDSQQQYEYYLAGNSKIAYNHAKPESTAWWALHSHKYDNNYAYCQVYFDGSPNDYDANVSGGIRPGFAV